MADEILVVASKVKKYIKDKSEMNTAGNVPDIISQKIRIMCDQAIEAARRDGRKTVKDRDFDDVGPMAGGAGGEM